MTRELDLDAAYAQLCVQAAAVQDTEAVATARARGRVLARDVVAAADLPAQDLAAMDGYAVRSAELGAGTNELPVAGRVLAGRPFEGRAGPASCLRIMTGAPMPEGFDAVVIQEVAVPAPGGRVVLPGPVEPGLNRRRRGEHVTAGSTVLAAGRQLRPADLNLASAAGAGELRVYRRLRAGVFSTGDELRDPPAPLPEGGAYDGNRPMLLAALERQGIDAEDLGICPDEATALERIVAQAGERELDVLLVSGGAAQGDADIVRMMPGVAFLPVRVRPGRGLAWARLEAAGRRLVLIGLPGNGVAAYVLFNLLALPVLRHMAGAQAGVPQPVWLPAAAPMRNRPGKIDMRRGRLVRNDSGATAVEIFAQQGSAMIRGVSEAQVLIEVGPLGEYRAGDLMPCHLIEALEAS
jgi:molybdopterin molybdotransferase